MPYGKEDTDYKTDGDASSGYIFNGAENVFWCRIRDLCGSQLRALYQQLDSANCWSDTGLINEFDAWQEQFPEEIWRIDIERKYYRTYTGQSVDNSIAGASTPRFLTQMMNGRKKYQRRQFERDQAVYMGTKFLSTSVTSDQIMFRCNTPVQATIEPDYTITIVPYSDMYLSVKFGNLSTVSQVRAKAGQTYSIPCPLTTMDDTAILIYGASRIQALNDLSTCYIHDNDFSKATKIQTLIIGSNVNGYSNSFLTTLNIGNNQLLETLDVRNCPNLTGSLNLSGCGNLTTLRAQGTSLTGVTFATNGKITSAYLPDTITSISMSNLKNLTTLSLDYTGLESVIIENSIVDSKAIVSGGQATIETLRLVGIDWEISNINLLEAIYGMSNTYLSGNVYINGSISSRYLAKYNAKWSDLNITYATYVQEYAVTFQNDDGTVLDVQWVERGGTAVNPITRQTNPIATPTKASTIDTVYTFSAWDSDAYLSAVYGALTITATYATSVRTYTVKFYVEGTLKQTSTVEYGSGVEYDYDTYGEPSKADDVEHDIYYLWSGWDKNHYRIYGDTNVNAVFVAGETPAAPSDPSNKPKLNTRSIAEINAICRSGQKDWETVFMDGTNSSFEQQYFDLGDEIDITTGWEPDDTESNSHLIYDLGSSPCTLHYNTTANDEGVAKANGVTLPLVLNQNTNDTSSEDADPMYVDTGVKLMYNGGTDFGDNDNYEFTWVLDFALNDTAVYGGNVSSEPNILDCVATNDGYDHGFKVYAASSGQCSLKYAASSMTAAASRSVGSGSYLVTDPVAHTYTTTSAAMNQSFLERLIVRKKKGERGVTVYRCNPTSTTHSTTTLSYSGNNRVAHQRTVLLGCGRSAYGYPAAAMLANCTIYNFKVWNVALSDLEMAKMAVAPKETLKYRLQVFPRTTYGATASYNYMISLGTATESNPNPASIYPGISLGSTNLMRNYRQMNSSNTNVGGWNSCAMRTWLNNRLFKGFPQILKSAVKTVNVRASAGGGASTPPDSAYEIVTSRDKLFLWSTREYGGYSGSPYNDEGKAISLYSSDATRHKYHQFGHVMIYYYYWTRSPYLQSAAYFCGVSGSGHNSYGTASTPFGVAPGLCI